MSRSQPRLTSPVTRTFEWAGSRGELNFYDRETKERVPVSLPFEFLVLDQLATITGFSRNAKSRIWSNEVRPEDLKTEPFIVKTKGEELFNGLYQKGLGANEYGYTQAIYIAYLGDGGNYEVGKLMAAGSARGAWFDFRKSCNVENGKVLLTGKGELEKNGATEWYPPVFKWENSDKQQDDIALRLDKIVQQYLITYFKAGRVERDQDVQVFDETAHWPNNDGIDDTPPMDDAEFDSLLSEGAPEGSIDYNPNDLPLRRNG